MDEARRRGEPLLVVNMSRDDVLVDARRAGEEQLDRVGRDLAELVPAFLKVRQIEEGSDAAEVLLKVAEEEKASVVVIGLRHRSPVGKLLLGSVAQRVLLDATCPCWPSRRTDATAHAAGPAEDLGSRR